VPGAQGELLPMFWNPRTASSFPPTSRSALAGGYGLPNPRLGIIGPDVTARLGSGYLLLRMGSCLSAQGAGRCEDRPARTSRPPAWGQGKQE